MKNRRKTIITKDEVYEKILPDDVGTLFDAPFYTEFRHYKKTSDNMPLSKYKRIDKDTYVDTETGEIMKYKRNEKKTEGSFKENHKNIPAIIKGHFEGNNTERHIILKYDKPVYTPESLSEDFKKFLKRFNKVCSDYIYVYGKEPFSDGPWHIHCIIKVANEEFDFSEEIISELWKKGRVIIEKIRDIDRFCWRFDILRTEEKRKRLRFYPANFHPFGYTRGLNKNISNVPYKDVPNYTKNKELIYKQQYSVGCFNDNGELNNFGKIKYEQYKLK